MSLFFLFLPYILLIQLFLFALRAHSQYLPLKKTILHFSFKKAYKRKNTVFINTTSLYLNSSRMYAKTPFPSHHISLVSSHSYCCIKRRPSVEKNPKQAYAGKIA
uniref:Putative secreted protein n=1 Tax=Anopheles darlingi TaxID=43151 RepID=A0A2M4DCV1_ANODA